jgi:DNA-binding CsgD family transcriptional regulator
MKQLDRIEWKLDNLIDRLNNGLATKQVSPPIEADDRPEVVLAGFTTKQHGVIQMLCRSATNGDIAKRLQITENTAKVHVRTIARKFGVQMRAQVILKTINALKEIDDESYRLLSKGLPKDWDANYDKEGGKAFDHLIIGDGVGNGT